ncbi:MAG: hypothetical protein A2096_12565 [Spirochaetes bacterium GWF1_41_5]|nr:MAG: hypothetical protein A2096_12565 [Spirochaetes bacterium GWF1_41_5]
MRLGFSIAIFSEPDILLADEVLAVGDLQFILKCFRKISEYKRNGGTVFLVSHSMPHVRNFCSKAIWIDRGIIKMYAAANDVCNEYEKDTFVSDQSAGSETGGFIINNDKSISLPVVKFLNRNSEEIKTIKNGEELIISILFMFKRKVIKPVFTVTFFTLENIQVISNYSNLDRIEIDYLQGEGSIDFIIKKLNLKPSKYYCHITLGEFNDPNNVLEWHDKYYSFVVESDHNYFYGLYNPYPEWKLNS